MGQNPVATFAKTFSTGANVQDPTTYKNTIDGDMAVLARLGDAFSAHANSTPDMRVYLNPGHIFSGSALTEIGAYTAGTVTSGSPTVTITGSVAGISGTMLVSGPGIPAATTATISGNTVTLSANATATQTAAPLVFMQRSAAITAPGSNSRIDRIVADRMTGAVSIITGTPGTTPAAPALTSGVIPIAQVLITSSTTAITNSMITDERDTALLGCLASGQVSIASATTTDLGTTKSDNVLITGTTTITGFGSSASLDAPLYAVTFAAALTLTYNATSLIIPGAQNIATAAGDFMTVKNLGSGNWQVMDYQKASGQNLSVFATTTSIASATTTDLGTVASNSVNITGTTAITGLGSSASLANPIYMVKFAGVLTLTYNATSLIIPGAANITTAAGDTMIAEYLGSGNWKVWSYFKLSGASSGNLINIQVFKTSGTFTPTAGSTKVRHSGIGGGAGAGGVGGAGGNGGQTSVGSILVLGGGIASLSGSTSTLGGQGGTPTAGTQTWTGSAGQNSLGGTSAQGGTGGPGINGAGAGIGGSTGGGTGTAGAANSGAGGGGGGNNGSVNSSGGAGAGAQGWYYGATSTQTVTIGSGGTAGATNGSQGGSGYILSEEFS